MVEGGAQIVPEGEILEALFAGHDAIQPLLQIQEEFRRELGKAQTPRAVGRARSKRSSSASMTWPRPNSSRRWKSRKNSNATSGSPKSRAKSCRRLWPSFPISKKISRVLFEELKKNVFRGLVIHQGAAHRRPRPERHPADLPAKSKCCRAPTARRSSPAARLRPWSLRLSAPLPTSSGSML